MGERLPRTNKALALIHPQARTPRIHSLHAYRSHTHIEIQTHSDIPTYTHCTHTDYTDTHTQIQTTQTHKHTPHTYRPDTHAYTQTPHIHHIYRPYRHTNTHTYTTYIQTTETQTHIQPSTCIHTDTHHTHTHRSHRHTYTKHTNTYTRDHSFSAYVSLFGKKDFQLKEQSHSALKHSFQIWQCFRQLSPLIWGHFCHPPKPSHAQEQSLHLSHHLPHLQSLAFMVLPVLFHTMQTHAM